MFSIIIPWMAGNNQRERNFTKMVSCLVSQFFIDYEIITVEQTLKKPDKTHYYCNSVNCKHIYLQSGQAFNKSWCINVAARQAKYEDLIVWDADIIVGKYFLQQVKEELKKQQPIFVCWDKMIAIAGKDNPKERIVLNETIRTMGGIWYANRDFFFNQLGGMNENYFGYGGEDCDLYLRACSALASKEVHRMQNTITHLYHDWEYIDHSEIPDYVHKLNFTRNNTQRVIQRLKRAAVGRKEKPTLIDMEKR